jgi:hypothetical protein
VTRRWTNPRVKEFQQKRLAVLEKLHEVTKQLFTNEQVAYEDVHAAKVELLAARRDYADTQEGRIKACDEAVQEAVAWHTLVQARVETGRASPVDQLKAQAFLLEAQLTRENAGPTK